MSKEEKHEENTEVLEIEEAEVVEDNNEIKKNTKEDKNLDDEPLKETQEDEDSGDGLIKERGQEDKNLKDDAPANRNKCQKCGKENCTCEEECKCKNDADRNKDCNCDENCNCDKKSGNTEKRSGNKAAMTLAVLALVLAGTSATFSILSYQKSMQPLTILNSGEDGNATNFVEGSIADVVNKVSQSVVSIVTSVKSTSFFGQSYESQAAGTGIIVTEDGYILTNKHVIEGATSGSIKVILDDGTTYKDVMIAAADSLNDVAYLKIKDVSGLTPATLGDSKTIQVGQQVVAIGNALGEYQNTVTSGVVSGTGRSLTATDASGSTSEQLSDMIQTDAAINSGNSGGPLINAAGQVIGINTATSSSAENVGFAIPIAATKGMLAQLKETGEAKRAYLGVYTTEITASSAKEYNLPVTTGAYLYASGGNYSAVVSGGPAAKAGLKEKDIITAVNGVKIGAAGSLSTLIGEYKPGDTVQLTVIRDGKEIGVNVELEGYKEK